MRAASSAVLATGPVASVEESRTLAQHDLSVPAGALVRGPHARLLLWPLVVIRKLPLSACAAAQEV
jgi:hypothetical protein